MNSSLIIKKQLEKIGNVAVLKDGGWTSMPFKCSLDSLWRKKSSTFNDDVNMTGVKAERYYLFIGPYTHDITALSDNAVLSVNGKNYAFIRKNGIDINDETVYYTGIVREVKEAEYDEY